MSRVFEAQRKPGIHSPLRRSHPFDLFPGDKALSAPGPKSEAQGERKGKALRINCHSWTTLAQPIEHKEEEPSHKCGADWKNKSGNIRTSVNFIVVPERPDSKSVHSSYEQAGKHRKACRQEHPLPIGVDNNFVSLQVHIIHLTFPSLVFRILAQQYHKRQSIRLFKLNKSFFEPALSTFN